MEFQFPLFPIFGRNSITVWDAARIKRLNPALQERLGEVVNRMGAGSAKAQSLPSVITTMSKMLCSDHHLYLYLENFQKVVGLLKMGRKNLFIRDELARMHEISPLCCLDFYVVEGNQRKGIGKLLFEAMLSQERIPPEKMGYDRPSPKLLGFASPGFRFLRRHYGLARYVPQSNNFVVFSQYFESSASDKPSGPPLPMPTAAQTSAPAALSQAPVIEESAAISPSHSDEALSSPACDTDSKVGRGGADNCSPASSGGAVDTSISPVVAAGNTTAVAANATAATTCPGEKRRPEGRSATATTTVAATAVSTLRRGSALPMAGGSAVTMDRVLASVHSTQRLGLGLSPAIAASIVARERLLQNTQQQQQSHPPAPGTPAHGLASSGSAVLGAMGSAHLSSPFATDDCESPFAGHERPRDGLAGMPSPVSCAPRRNSFRR